MNRFPCAKVNQNSKIEPRINGESLLIEQLRRENAMLKTQLEGMMKMQMQTVPNRSSPINKVAPWTQTANIHISEEDSAENAYRNKMSKLKSKKTNRGSMDHSTTTPCSPEGSILSHTPSKQAVPQLVLHNPQSKMMVIAQDNKGKFFRDRTQEERLQTVRRNTPSRSKFLQNDKVTKENHSPRIMSPRVHQRVQSALPLNAYLCQTKRTNTNYPQSAYRIEQQIHTKNNFYQKQANPQQKAILNTRGTVARQPSIQCKEIKSPKGNAYMEKMDREENHKLTSNSAQIEQSNGDSRLSIEIGLRQAKSNKRLNYGVYLEDQQS